MAQPEQHPGYRTMSPLIYIKELLAVKLVASWYMFAELLFNITTESV